MGTLERLAGIASAESLTRDPENVWDYPRPPRVERVHTRLAVEVWGRVVAETTEGVRVLETSHPPVYYFPVADVAMELLAIGRRRTTCEFKGEAIAWDLLLGRHKVASIAWSFPEPQAGYDQIKDHFAFHAARCSRCLVGDEVVTPQPGDFYGGWVTRNLRGPFDGAAESLTGVSSW